MENDERKRNCCQCGCYYAYYTKGYANFNREKLGYCRVKRESVTNTSTCEYFISNESRKHRYRKYSVRLFNETLRNMNEAAQAILEEYRDDSDMILSEEKECEKSRT